MIQSREAQSRASQNRWFMEHNHTNETIIWGWSQLKSRTAPSSDSAVPAYTQWCMNWVNASSHVFWSSHMFCSVHHATRTWREWVNQILLFGSVWSAWHLFMLNEPTSQWTQPEQPFSAMLHNSKWSSDQYEENAICSCSDSPDPWQNNSPKSEEFIHNNTFPFIYL